MSPTIRSVLALLLVTACGEPSPRPTLPPSPSSIACSASSATRQEPPYEPKKPLKSVYRGLDATCVVDAGDRLICWGDNGPGCNWAIIPHPVIAPVEVSVGTFTVCARDARNRGACTTIQEPGKPLLVERFADVTRFDVQGKRLCWRTRAEPLRCRWLPTQRRIRDDGWHEYEMGVPNPETGDRRPPRIPELDACPEDLGCEGIVERARGQNHECVLYQDGSVWCRGSNEAWQLGYKTGRNERWEDLPWRPVPGIDDATQVGAQGHQTCVLRGKGELWCWGGLMESRHIDHDADCPAVVPGMMSNLGPLSCASPKRIEAPFAIDVAVEIEVFFVITASGDLVAAPTYPIDVSRAGLLTRDDGSVADNPLCINP